MIGRLRGTVAEKGADGVLIDVGGVGYQLQCPLTVVDRMPRTGQECTLAIHTHVREDQITLFGFTDVDQRRMFRLLIGVNNVGPKIGLACLSGMDDNLLRGAISTGDIKRLSAVPGIGKRTAERIVLELQDKVGPTGGVPASRHPAFDDLQSALTNLGYKSKDVDSLIAELGPAVENQTFEQLLREALKRLRPS